MANVLNPFFYGMNYFEYISGVQGISMQFHLTARCDQSCKHCYMHNSPYYKEQIQNSMDKDTILKLIDDYMEFLGEYSCTGFIALTGGDPILSPYFWEVLEHINEYYRDRCGISILGNPYHITHASARKMKQLGVERYQISLDGLKKTHDYLRKPGSFDTSMKALKILYEEDIETLVSFTVSKLNADDLIPLYDYLQRKDFISAFGFDRMIPTGSGQNMKEELFTPQEYREFLFRILKHEIFNYNRLIISKKEEMWKLLLYELGLIDPINTSKKRHYITGCNCGTGTFSVVADGTIFPCRKLEWSAGKYPERSLQDILINNEVTKMFRQHDDFKGCSNCEANVICRGCPAMKYAVTGDFYGMEPYCWRESVER